MLFKSKIKWVGLVGMVLSAFSLFTHLLLASYTGKNLVEYRPLITIFTWRPIFGNADLSRTSSRHRRLWGPVKPLESLHPHANPRGNYQASGLQTNGFIFVKIQGEFHEIQNSICDVVVVSRLLNAALVIPELQSTTSTKGISSGFKSFAYLYNEEQFIAALANDVVVVKSLPKKFKSAKRKNEIPMFRVPHSASPEFYLELVLPVLLQHLVVELVVSDGACLQALLPPHLEECQRLRCRVAFHALRFRQEVQELGTKILHRLQATRRPFLAFFPGLTRDALAYHGCSELFQDLHAELIQHRRLRMIKHGIVKGNLSMDSVQQHLNGSCPLMPEEVGILLRAYGYPSDTIIYVAGGELFGGQRMLIPLHAMFENVVDRTSLSTNRELESIYGCEDKLFGSSHQPPPFITEEMKVAAWKKSGPRPRPLPPPPARPKYPYNREGWWGWIGVLDKEPQITRVELRTRAHKLIWEAIDYMICTEADAFIPGFDRDGMGRPNFASLVMGHRLYQSAASKTFRPDRTVVARLINEIRGHLYQPNRTWLTSMSYHLTKTILEGLTQASSDSKPLSFLSHPVPECLCSAHNSSQALPVAPSPSRGSKDLFALGVKYRCPAWMNSETEYPEREKVEEEEEIEDPDIVSGQFFLSSNDGVDRTEVSNKEDVQMDDQDELEGGER